MVALADREHLLAESGVDVPSFQHRPRGGAELRLATQGLQVPVDDPRSAAPHLPTIGYEGHQVILGALASGPDVDILVNDVLAHHGDLVAFDLLEPLQGLLRHGWHAKTSGDSLSSGAPVPQYRGCRLR